MPPLPLHQKPALPKPPQMNLLRFLAGTPDILEKIFVLLNRFDHAPIEDDCCELSDGARRLRRFSDRLMEALVKAVSTG